MINRQVQEAGDGSTNFQAQTMTVVMGIDEKRAREIYHEMSLQQRNEYTQEALVVANKRVEAFENSLMPKMEVVEGALEAFADPSFQLLLVNAQKAAAATEREADYDLLSELLIHRFQRGEDRMVRAGISRAVEIVDEVSDEALLGLTVFHAVSHFFPSASGIQAGLDILNELFGTLMYGALPKGKDWLDHLDILDAVRVTQFSELKKIQQYYSESLSGYTSVGLKKDSDNYVKAVEILEANNLPRQVLIEHELNSNYVRLCVPQKDALKDLMINWSVLVAGSQVISRSPLSSEQVLALNSIWDMYDKDPVQKQANDIAFMDEWAKRSNLAKLRKWWDDIGISIQITSVGRVLAHSNAQRCDKSLPAM